MTPFPAGTTGQRIEMFARRAPVARAGQDYAHGTGHGVGQYLGVHEGPHSLKDLATPPLVAGNLFSIEPGYYENGKFGIRIENLAFVVRDEKLSTDGDDLATVRHGHALPHRPRLVDRKLMDADQIAWLNAYHKRVYREAGRCWIRPPPLAEDQDEGDLVRHPERRNPWQGTQPPRSTCGSSASSPCSGTWSAPSTTS